MRGNADGEKLAGRIKDNRSKLRKTVHAPHEEARYARLSEKLLETARSNVTAAGMHLQAPAFRSEPAHKLRAANESAEASLLTRINRDQG